MKLSDYEELTGTTVTESEQDLIKAQIKRTKTILENMLGYSLSNPGENFYFEAGKSPSDFIIPDDNTELLPADEVQGAYRIFNYHEHDTYLSIDPIETLYVVKLVYMRPGPTPNGITIRTFDSDEIAIRQSAGNVQKYIEKITHCWWPECTCLYTEKIQLAIDADWMFYDCLPDNLKYIWADMVTYYADCKRNIKRETLGTHTYEKFDRGTPESLSENIAILNNYVGANGSLNQTLTL